MEELWNCPECDKVVKNPKGRGPHLSACRRSQKAKYIYLDGDTKHPYEKKACVGCKKIKLIQTRRKYCSVSCKQNHDNSSNIDFSCTEEELTRKQYCNKCNLEKFLYLFSKDSTTQNKRSRYCKDCSALYRKENYSPIPRYKIYGLTEQEFDSLQILHPVCAICKKEDKLHIDHNHTTGKVRGLLCKECNMAIGLLKDDITLMKSAIKYLSGRIE